MYEGIGETDELGVRDGLVGGGIDDGGGGEVGGNGVRDGGAEEGEAVVGDGKRFRRRRERDIGS